MNKIKNILKQEFGAGYTLFEKLFLVWMLLFQIVIFIMDPEGILSIIAGIAGVISVVLCAKGKISFYFIGFVQTISYLFLAYQNQFYGEVIENIFYLVTMIWGIFEWKRHLNRSDETGTQIEAKKFTKKQWVYCTLVIVISTIITGYLLSLINNAQPYTDATTNVLAIVAQLLMVKRYREQWIFWVLIDLLCIKMWMVAGSLSMVAMYIAWTFNCIYGWINWSKLSKQGNLNLNLKEIN